MKRRYWLLAAIGIAPLVVWLAPSAETQGGGAPQIMRLATLIPGVDGRAQQNQTDDSQQWFDPPWIFFGMDERGINTDLNGDGDATDHEVAHAYNVKTGQLTNTRLAGRWEFPLGDSLGKAPGFLLVEVREGDQNIDYNGDGDMWDKIKFLVRFGP